MNCWKISIHTHTRTLIHKYYCLALVDVGSKHYEYIVVTRWRHWSLPYLVGGVRITGPSRRCTIFIRVRVCILHAMVCGRSNFLCVCVCLCVCICGYIYSPAASAFTFGGLRGWAQSFMYFMLRLLYFGIDPKCARFLSAPK